MSLARLVWGIVLVPPWKFLPGIPCRFTCNSFNEGLRIRL